MKENTAGTPQALADISYLDFSIERLILKNGNLINNARDGDLKSFELTETQSETVLFYAANAGKSIKELSVHLEITQQAAKKLVDKLSSKGILKSEISEEDRRFTKIFLTEKGVELYKSLKEKGSSLGGRILKSFSDDEKKQLLSYLKKIKENIEAEKK